MPSPPRRKVTRKKPSFCETAGTDPPSCRSRMRSHPRGQRPLVVGQSGFTSALPIPRCNARRSRRHGTGLWPSLLRLRFLHRLLTGFQPTRWRLPTTLARQSRHDPVYSIRLPSFASQCSPVTATSLNQEACVPQTRYSKMTSGSLKDELWVVRRRRL